MSRDATSRRDHGPRAFSAGSAGLLSALALAGVLLAAGQLQAQDRGHIEGRVLVSGSDEPVQDARIELKGRYRITETDSLGRFRFSSVGTGEYTVVAEKDGYADGSAPVTVRVSEISEVEIRLDPEGAVASAGARCSSSVRRVLTLEGDGTRRGVPPTARPSPRRARLERGRRPGVAPPGR